MSGLRALKHLDYAVYGNIIVPMLMFDAQVMFELYDDSEQGRCRIVCRPRKRK